jgi:hypothetical protein
MTTTYCTHRYEPIWHIDVDGLGRMICATCGAPVTPDPPQPRTAELIPPMLTLAVALLGAALWFWWTWLA